EFRHNASRAERITQLHNDRLKGSPEPTTFFQMARVADELEAQGRHAIDRAEPAIAYPKLPAASPWGSRSSWAAAAVPAGYLVCRARGRTVRDRGRLGGPIGDRDSSSRAVAGPRCRYEIRSRGSCDGQGGASGFDPRDGGSARASFGLWPSGGTETQSSE